MKFPAQMSLVRREGGKKKWSRGKKVPEQHSFGSGAGRVGAFLMF